MIELGPIRPPSEAESILLRVTRNCAWNKCGFCSLYEGERFSVRKFEDIKDDIDQIANIYSELKELSIQLGFDGKIAPQVVQNFEDKSSYDNRDIQQVAYWSYFGLKNLFFQDGDSMVLSADKIVEILDYISIKLPTVERITTYARSSSIAKKSLNELKLIRKAGLNRIHIGFESGSDDVLKLINKGVSAEEHIRAGKNIMEAGFELSEYFMPGIGGVEFSEKHALESANVLNQINPTFIRMRSFVPIPGTEMNRLMEAGDWMLQGEVEKIVEIKKFIENLNDIDSKIISDHMLNLLQELEGSLPVDKEKMVQLLDNFLSLKLEDQENFIIGRRTGQFRFLANYESNEKLSLLRNNLKNQFGTIDNAVLDMMRRYI